MASPDGASHVTVHRVEGPDQVLVPWPAAPLHSRQPVAARVRFYDGSTWGPWSDPGHVEVGLLDASDWSALLVGPAEQEGRGGAPGRLRAEFELPSGVRSARAYVTAHGLAEVEINGVRAGDEELTPGWTSYHHRLRYATFDVTALVREGANAIGVWLADGCWRGRLGFGGGVSEVYGDRIGAMVQLEVVTSDGRVVTVASDGSWRAGSGPILSADLYDGEHFDAQRHDPSWSLPGFPTQGWGPVTAMPLIGELVAPTGPPVRVTDELAPVSVEDKGDGRWLVDFGQNHSGRVRLRADGPAGRLIRVRHAEVLQGGELCLEPLRTAQATDVLILAGAPIEWEPRFTIHGYRYVEIDGWEGELRPEHVASRVLHTDMQRVGWFRSSDALVNRLHENVVWSLRSNFVDIPTDCPQRDERLGWTGDLQVFAPTAAFLYDVTGMLSSWLRDLAAEQTELDWVPPYVPYVALEPFNSLPRDPMALWGASPS